MQDNKFWEEEVFQRSFIFIYKYLLIEVINNEYLFFG